MPNGYTPYDPRSFSLAGTRPSGWAPGATPGKSKADMTLPITLLLSLIPALFGENRGQQSLVGL